ncbi:peptidoglycan editing factor PgeF [Desulfobacterales bacterium HSG2]|nr:peptidoglycan editing factor PgeF [Desulfobacterales bacterium HSG2]
MISKQKNNIPFFQFPNLSAFSDLRHGVFTRTGGYSKGPHQSLNVGFSVGDEEGRVRENRRLISQCMDGKDLVFVNQVHGTEVFQIRNPKPETRNSYDAMVTDVSDIILVIQVADCQAVIMYDPVRRVAANVHSGWRGSVKNIISHTVNVMEKDFSCNPCNIVAGIGPSLGQCCAEFINYKTEIPESLWKYKDASDHFDFRAVTKEQLCNAGVSEENIYSDALCTRCNTDMFFSYRGEGTTGRFGVAIGLKMDSGSV